MVVFENIEFAGLTDVGLRRANNQDSLVALPADDAAQWRERGHLFVVADGMGAHAVGELASKLAVDGIAHLFTKPQSTDAPIEALLRAFTETNANIYTRGQQNRDFHGMGTTASALLLRPEGAWIAHVGDSRVYRVRDGQIEQLTFDHSYVWEMARRQNCRPEDLHGIRQNIIVRSIGPNPDVDVDLEGPHPLKAGDIFVLCSDGLSGQVTDREIGAVVSAMPPEQACRFLVDLANLQGGPDNITVQVVRVTAAEPVEAPAPSSPSWVTRTPWPMIALGCGLLLAVLALLLTSQDLPGAGVAFVIGALAVVGGVAGLILQARQETHAVEPGAKPRKLHIYRHAACAIQLPLLEKLARAEATLQDRIREKDWTADWSLAQQHRDKARRHLDLGHLPDAFREYCLAMRPLAEAMQREHQKKDPFEPLWEKEE